MVQALATCIIHGHEVSVHVAVSGADGRCVGHVHVHVAGVEGPVEGADRLIGQDVAAVGGFFDDAFLETPVGEIFVFALFFACLGEVTGVVATDVFHALVPAALTFEDSATEAAGAALRWFALLVPAAVADFFQAVLKGAPVLTVGVLDQRGLGFVHASVVLGEEVLAVEVVVDLLVGRGVGIVLGRALADITAIEAELQVLDGDVSLPLVLGAEGGLTAVGGEGTDELSLGWFGPLGARAGAFSSSRFGDATW